VVAQSHRCRQLQSSWPQPAQSRYALETRCRSSTDTDPEVFVAAHLHPTTAARLASAHAHPTIHHLSAYKAVIGSYIQDALQHH